MSSYDEFKTYRHDAYKRLEIESEKSVKKFTDLLEEYSSDLDKGLIVCFFI